MPGSTRYEITSPLFTKSEMNVVKDKKQNTFAVTAKNNSPQNIYIQSAKLNGKEYAHCYIEYADIVTGGKLELTMGSKPNKNWGIN